MADAGAVWQALQGLGVLGILVICLWAVSTGAYITRDSHEELLGEFSREIARLEAKIDQLEAALAAKGWG